MDRPVHRPPDDRVGRRLHNRREKRAVALRRLALRDRIRPDFKVLTGNDLGIDMVEYGSDYLLGLATFSPEIFAKRDAHWAAGNAEYFAVSDALQLLGNIAFRAPVPAYKHSAAWFLYLQGRIPTPLTHPGSPARPDWEPEILRMCAQRCGIELVRWANAVVGHFSLLFIANLEVTTCQVVT